MTKKKQSAHTKRVRKLAKRVAPSAATRRKSASDEIERILVEGVLTVDENDRELRHVPSYREIAKLFHIAHSLVAHVAKAKDCAHRHELYREANPQPFEEYDKEVERRNAERKSSEQQEAEQAKSEKSAEAEALKKALSEKRDECAKTKSPRKAGRPIRPDSPAVPWNEVDKALVLGEMAVLPSGEQTTIYPGLRELARRYGVAHSAIVRYSLTHQCERRRETAQLRLIQKTEEKVLDLRATAIAVSKDDVLRMIDKYLLKFEKAIDDDRVRYDVPADFNTLVRLKEFVSGGPDSRQENTTTFTLEMLQERHAQVLKATRDVTPAERGIVDVTGREAVSEPTQAEDATESCIVSDHLDADHGTGSVTGDLSEDRGGLKADPKEPSNPPSSASDFTRVESTDGAEVDG